MSRPPLIAVPHWRAPTWERTQYYYDSLLAAGAEYVLVDSAELPAGVQGLLLTGGADVDPSLYGEKRRPGTDRPNKERDQHELGLLRRALERDIPVLCICRGHQLLNVALGGALLQDIQSDGHKWLADSTSSWHEVTLDGPPSRLAAVYGPGRTLRVNSRHHQGVTPDRVAAPLGVVARSPDGFVEAVEATDRRWVMGVQWHPERPEMRPDAAPLFVAFVRAAAR
jgi:putative glutamine amidotransferase